MSLTQRLSPKPHYKSGAKRQRDAQRPRSKWLSVLATLSTTSGHFTSYQMTTTCCFNLDTPWTYLSDQIDFLDTKIDAKTCLLMKLSTYLLIWS